MHFLELKGAPSNAKETSYIIFNTSLDMFSWDDIFTGFAFYPHQISNMVKFSRKIYRVDNSNKHVGEHKIKQHIEESYLH